MKTIKCPKKCPKLSALKCTYCEKVSVSKTWMVRKCRCIEEIYFHKAAVPNKEVLYKKE